MIKLKTLSIPGWVLLMAPVVGLVLLGAFPVAMAQEESRPESEPAEVREPVVEEVNGAETDDQPAGEQDSHRPESDSDTRPADNQAHFELGDPDRFETVNWPMIGLAVAAVLIVLGLGIVVYSLRSRDY